jgi:hypothetical protein
VKPLKLKQMHFDCARTTPIGLSRHAEEFFDTAMAADDVVGMRPGYEFHAPVPVMYLVGHAIELSLKAFLAAKRVSLKELASKKYGHDLWKLFQRANELGLNVIVKLEDDQIKGLKVLNDLYCTKQLNYIVTGEKTFPTFGAIQSFTERLIEAVGRHVGYK